jgi:glycosyltransferase involved in cell wall biosynthesis
MVDVLFFCEGTYPYVSGGVSSWIHQLITGMPELKFGILYLATSQNAERELKYQLPPNVEEMIEFYLYDFVDFPRSTAGSKAQAWADVSPFLRGLFAGQGDSFGKAYRAVCGEDGMPALSYQDLTRSKESWDLLVEVYSNNFKHASFSDFFWSWRYAHYPLYKLFSAHIPKAKVYHAVTTGWCGLLGAIGARRHNRPLLLTEHGLYVNERRIEISQADWIFVDAPRQGQLEVGLGTFKELWINLFMGLGRVTYQEADQIFTLFEGNRKLQVEFGAPAERIQIVPNGVNIPVLANPPSRALSRDNSRFRVGFVGRIVPIKDVKTLIKSARIVAQQIPDVEFYLCGPYDEDPEYFGECQTLVDALGLRQTVKFMGAVDVKTYYPCFDVQVLTSISEGQPLVILEGFCSGLPCVASDVGACSEMINGRGAEDQALGPAGLVTWVGNPRQTAEAILKLHADPGLRQRMGQAGKSRVERFYNQSDLLNNYKQIYTQAMVAPARSRALAGR